MSERSSLCIACGAEFGAADTGLMQCRIHPLPIDTSSLHYTCCNAAPTKAECVMHYEESRPRGCHRIDHAETHAERTAMLERPYRVVSLEHVHAHLPYARDADGVNVFHVTEDPAKAGQVIALDVSSWRSRPDTTISVDLVNESARLRLAMDSAREAATAAGDEVDPIPEDPNDEAFYYSYGHGADPALGGRGAEFVPFAVVRCVGAGIDPDKRDEIMAHCQCGGFA